MSNPYTPDFEKKPCAYCKGKAARCHACKHTGFKTTKRGEAARRHFIALLTKPALELAINEMMWFRDGHKKIASPIKSLVVEGARIRVVGYNRREQREITNYLVANTRVEMAFDGPELLELTRQAEAYQASLNKDGSVSRRIRRAA